VNKAQAAQYTKIGVTPKKLVRELRHPAEDVAKFDVGAVIKPSEVFEVGQHIDVTGQSKGRGFTGVMKRWNFKGSKSKSHGTHEYKRHGGSIGTNLKPGRTLANTKMPGQHGNVRVTIQNLLVARVMDDEGLLLVEGSVPGPANGYVTVRGAAQKRGGITRAS